MQGLTPEQIQDMREEIDGQIAPGATENQRAHAAAWLECRQIDALLAAAESVGKLEQRVARLSQDIFGGDSGLSNAFDQQETTIASLRAQLTPREQENERLKGLSKALVDKLAVTEEACREVYESAFIHGVKYAGPTYVAEREALLAALAPSQPPHTTETRG